MSEAEKEIKPIGEKDFAKYLKDWKKQGYKTEVLEG